MVDEELPHYHWYPVALYNYDGTKIRDLTKEEQIKWIKEQKRNGGRLRITNKQEAITPALVDRHLLGDKE